MRSALSQVLDFGTQRGIVAGKLFDFRLTVVATVLITGYLALTAYVAIATSRGVQFLVHLGLRSDVMGGLEYAIGRLLAFVLVVALIFLLYRFIPVRGIPTRAALVGAADGVDHVRADARRVRGAHRRTVAGDDLHRNAVHHRLRCILGVLRRRSSS